jgi:hypothetical protein
VHGEDRGAPQLADAEELLLPDLAELAGGGDLLVPGDGVEPEVGGVVEDPLHRDLDHRVLPTSPKRSEPARVDPAEPGW